MVGRAGTEQKGNGWLESMKFKAGLDMGRWYTFSVGTERGGWTGRELL